MKSGLVVVAALALACSTHAWDKVDLSVLYVGNVGTERGDAYVAFLTERFAEVRAAARDGFDPASVGNADVVLLDWAQSDLDRGRGFGHEWIESPLGPRDAWSTPTVLLDSAGLLIGAPWQTIGTYG